MSKKPTTGLGTILGYRSRADMAVTEAIETGSTVAGLTPLFSILPDPHQPRDLLPDALYQRLFAGEPPTTIMQAWLTQTKEPSASPAQKRALEALEQLAATIEQHDLIQPIAICEAKNLDIPIPGGVTALIIAGERRWWAHVWLYLKNRKIKGREATHIKTITLSLDNNIRALQLIENVMREGLTAIERANGLVSLRQEMSKGQEQMVSWVAVERELGIDRAYRWRIEQVLTLCEEAKNLVRWHGLSEKAIRPVTTSKELQNRPDLQVRALQQLVRWQEANEEAGNGRLAQYVAQLLRPTAPTPNTSPDPVHLGQRLYKQASTTLKLFQGLNSGTILQIAESLTANTEAQDELIALEQRIAAMRRHWGR